LHMTQLMPLPLTVSCFSKIQIGFTFLAPADPGSPGQRAVKRVCAYSKLVWIIRSHYRITFVALVYYFAGILSGLSTKSRQILAHQLGVRAPEVNAVQWTLGTKVCRQLQYIT